MALCGKHGLNKHFHHEVAAAAFLRLLQSSCDQLNSKRNSSPEAHTLPLCPYY
jgi:hypothetical protein